MPKRKSSSRSWLREHQQDVYVRLAKRNGYRSRSSYKLLEINERDRIIEPGMNVLDLGSSPGGWSQVASQLVGHSGRVIASDILPMEKLPDVTFIEGDFTETETYERVVSAIGDQSLNVVLSDMAPNLSGLSAVDQPRAMYLVELATELASCLLSTGGTLAVKAFQGEGFEEWHRDIRTRFGRVVTRKPAASRARSRELYIVATNFEAF